MALLSLKLTGVNTYEATAVDVRTVGGGFNSFNTSLNVDAGSIMGIWMGGAKVSFGGTS